MAMLKTLARKGGTCADIKRYLEREGRAVTLDCSYDVRAERWSDDFDETRELWGKNDGRTYYHFVISPDPEDGLSAGDVRELACAWVQRAHPDAQWVVETHVDNGIPHAHIVANAVLPLTGKKLHFSNAEVAEDAATLQALCKERGMSAFDNFDIVANEEGEWVARTPLPKRDFETNARRAREAQRARRTTQAWMRKKGVHLWTDDMRDAVERAIEGCCTWKSFERALESAGYEARVSKRGVLTIYPTTGAGHPTKGYKLDESYTVEGIKARFRPNLGARRTVSALRPVARTFDLPQDFAEATIATAHRRYARHEDVDRLRGVLDAIAIAQRNGFSSLMQMARAAAEVSAEAEALRDELDAARIEYEHVEEAARLILRRSAVMARVGTRPRNPISERKWRKDYAEELERLSDIDEWLSEHGMSGEDSLEDVQRVRDELYRKVSSVADRAEAASREADRIGNAARAVGAVPGVPAGPPSSRAAEAKARPAPRLARIMTAEEWAEYVKGELARNRERAVEIARMESAPAPLPAALAAAQERADDAPRSVQANDQARQNASARSVRERGATTAASKPSALERSRRGRL